MKAVVLQTQGHEAAILVSDGTVRIARGRYAVGDVIDYKRGVRRGLLRWAAAAAAMVVLAGTGAGLWIDSNCVTYAEVSLDVNPSIVYSLNKRDRVLGVRAANGDALSVVEQLQGLRFSPLSEAVEKTMAALEDAGYLDADTDDYVLVNVSADEEARQARLTAEVETAMATAMEQNATIEYRIDHSDRETAREAADRGMSPGRYSAWQRDDDRPSPEDYADKPVRELMGGDPEEAGPPPSGDADGRDRPAPAEDHPRDGEPPSDQKEPSGEDQGAESDSAPGGEEKPEADTANDSKPQSDENRPSGQAPSDHQPDQSPGESRQSREKAEPGKSAEQKSPPREPKGDGHQGPPDGGR